MLLSQSPVLCISFLTEFCRLKTASLTSLVKSFIEKQSPEGEKGVLKIFAKFAGKDTPAQVLCCEFWEIFKNAYFYRMPPLRYYVVYQAKKYFYNLLLIIFVQSTLSKLVEVLLWKMNTLEETWARAPSFSNP